MDWWSFVKLGVLLMMEETEIRNWLGKERERKDALVNPSERRFCEYTICILEQVMGEN